MGGFRGVKKWGDSGGLRNGGIQGVKTPSEVSLCEKFIELIVFYSKHIPFTVYEVTQVNFIAHNYIYVPSSLSLAPNIANAFCF